MLPNGVEYSNFEIEHERSLGRVRKNNILRCVDLGVEVVVTKECHYHDNEPTARRHVLSIRKLTEDGAKTFPLPDNGVC